MERKGRVLKSSRKNDNIYKKAPIPTAGGRGYRGKGHKAFMNVLLVEDDNGIVSSLTDYLSGEGFSVDAANGQAEAVKRLKAKKYDIILVDINLNDGNGFSVCVAAKSEYDVPVIFLTASADENSIVAGLDLGADDYVPKPFRPRELVSRMKNAMRKYGSRSVVRLGNISVDAEKGCVKKNGEEIPLSALEFRILLTFVNNRGRLLTRDRLLEEIWDAGGDFVNDNTLTVYIKRIREKIEDDPSEPAIIKTVRGLGYKVD